MRHAFGSENILLQRQLGLAAAVAVTTNAAGGLLLGGASTIALCIVGVLLSVCARPLPLWGRVAASVIVAAGVWAALDAAMQALFYETVSALGGYPALMAASGLFVVFAPGLASERAGQAAVKGLTAGLGYTVLLTLAGVVRELFAQGSVFGYPVGLAPLALFAGPFGGFIALAFACALVQGVGGGKEAAA